MTVTDKEQSRALRHGAIAIPSFDPTIPLRTSNDALYDTDIAMFALVSDELGVALPAIPFSSCQETLVTQWQEYLIKIGLHGPDIYINASADFSIKKGRFRFEVTTSHRPMGYAMKSVVLSLEDCAKGLGWYVVDVLFSACMHGLKTADTRDIAELSCPSILDFETDQQWAKEWLANEGRTVPAGRVNAKTMAEIRGEQTMPSDYIAMVDGHAHLLGMERRDADEPMTREAARKTAISGVVPADLLPCVQCAIALDECFKADSCIALSEDTSADQDCYPGDDEEVDEDEDEEYADPDAYFEPPEIVGALCLLGWDDTELVFEALQHAEVSAMQGSSATNVIARRSVSLPASPEQYRELVVQMQTYFTKLNRFNALLNEFPMIEDET